MEPTTHLRPFTVDDIPAALDLWRRCEGIGLNASDTPERLTTFLLRNPDCSFVVETSSGLAGAVLGGHDGRRAFIYHLAVEPTQRGHGLGTALVEATLARFSALQLLRVSIHLFAHNEHGKAFWAASRWQTREDLLVMQQDL